MKLILSILFALVCAGCQTMDNVTTTKFSYVDPATGGAVSVEMPKEISAVNMKVTMDAKAGVVNITADKWVSQNQGTLNAEAAREVAVVSAVVNGISTSLGSAGGAALGSAAKAAVLPGVP